MNTLPVFEVIVSMVVDYRNRAFEAVKFNGGRLYVPVYMSAEDFFRLLKDPSQMNQTGANANEPAYSSFKEALLGRNADGSKHAYFFLVDVIDRKVLTIIDRNGQVSFDLTKELLEATWSGDQINVTRSNGDKIMIETTSGIRGIATVTVAFDLDSYNCYVLHGGELVGIKNITKAA